jgi:GT2 family glycosyltransferase
MNSLRTDAPSVSIIIVTYNSAPIIGACLRSLASLEGDARRLQVIVIDNASTDKTREIIRSTSPQVRMIENKENVGFAVGVNRAFELAESDLLLLVNPDAILQADFLLNLTQFMILYPHAGIVGSRLLNEQGAPQPSCWRTPGLMTVLIEALLPYEWSLALLAASPEASCEVEMVSAACVAVKRHVFEQLNGFDEKFFMYYEDSDFCLRARKKGIRVYFCHNASAVHTLRKPAESHTTTFFEHIYRSKMLFFRKHYRPAYSAIARLVVFSGVLFRIPVYLFAGVVLSNKPWMRLSSYHIAALKAVLAA